MRLLILEGVDEMDKRDEENEVRRRCMDCDSSFHLEYISKTVAHCYNCSSSATPMHPDRIFRKRVTFKVYGDDR